MKCLNVDEMSSSDTVAARVAKRQRIASSPIRYQPEPKKKPSSSRPKASTAVATSQTSSTAQPASTAIQFYDEPDGFLRNHKCLDTHVGKNAVRWSDISEMWFCKFCLLTNTNTSSCRFCKGLRQKVSIPIPEQLGLEEQNALSCDPRDAKALAKCMKIYQMISGDFSFKSWEGSHEISFTQYTKKNFCLLEDNVYCFMRYDTAVYQSLKHHDAGGFLVFDPAVFSWYFERLNDGIRDDIGQCLHDSFTVSDKYNMLHTKRSDWFRFLVFPLYHGRWNSQYSGHFTLAVVDFGMEDEGDQPPLVIHHYDSLGFRIKWESIQTVLVISNAVRCYRSDPKKFNVESCVLSIVEGKEKTPIHLYSRLTAQRQGQPDNYSCGMYVCMFYRMLLIIHRCLRKQDMELTVEEYAQKILRGILIDALDWHCNLEMATAGRYFLAGLYECITRLYGLKHQKNKQSKDKDDDVVITDHKVPSVPSVSPSTAQADSSSPQTPSSPSAQADLSSPQTPSSPSQSPLTPACITPTLDVRTPSSSCRTPASAPETPARVAAARASGSASAPQSPLAAARRPVLSSLLSPQTPPSSRTQRQAGKAPSAASQRPALSSLFSPQTSPSSGTPNLAGKSFSSTSFTSVLPSTPTKSYTYSAAQASRNAVEEAAALAAKIGLNVAPIALSSMQSLFTPGTKPDHVLGPLADIQVQNAVAQGESLAIATSLQAAAANPQYGVSILQDMQLQNQFRSSQISSLKNQVEAQCISSMREAENKCAEAVNQAQAQAAYAVGQLKGRIEVVESEIESGTPISSLNLPLYPGALQAIPIQSVQSSQNTRVRKCPLTKQPAAVKITSQVATEAVTVTSQGAKRGRPYGAKNFKTLLREAEFKTTVLVTDEEVDRTRDTEKKQETDQQIANCTDEFVKQQLLRARQKEANCVKHLMGNVLPKVYEDSGLAVFMTLVPTEHSFSKHIRVRAYPKEYEVIPEIDSAYDLANDIRDTLRNLHSDKEKQLQERVLEEQRLREEAQKSREESERLREQEAKQARESQDKLRAIALEGRHLQTIMRMKESNPQFELKTPQEVASYLGMSLDQYNDFLIEGRAQE